jgi:hypothetical protein
VVTVAAGIAFSKADAPRHLAGESAEDMLVPELVAFLPAEVDVPVGPPHLARLGMPVGSFREILD